MIGWDLGWRGRDGRCTARFFETGWLAGSVVLRFCGREDDEADGVDLSTTSSSLITPAYIHIFCRAWTTETNVVPETLEMIGSSSSFPLSGRTWGLWSGGSFTVCRQRALKTLSGTDLTDCALKSL